MISNHAMRYMTGKSIPIFLYIMSFILARVSRAKKKLHALTNILEIDFSSCSGLHDRKNRFANLFGKHFCADGTLRGRSMHPGFKGVPSRSSHCSGGSGPAQVFAWAHISLPDTKASAKQNAKISFVIRTSSTTTRDRNLQFQGAVSTGGSPLDFLLFLQVLCAI